MLPNQAERDGNLATASATEALLALEDGRVFKGAAFGAAGTATGEICFNTSMTGYQEILTDPSYRGQIVSMTCPQIGNYGANALDCESGAPHVRGFVIEELSPLTSNWRSEQDLDGFLKQHEIPGIQGVDTRALTKHLRERGAMKACLTTEITDNEEAIRTARECEGVENRDLVSEVTPAEAYEWDSDGTLSRAWIVTPAEPDENAADAAGNHFSPLPPVRHRIVALDCGMKKNILRMLRREGFAVRVLPAFTPAEEILAHDPDGIFLSNGPGDPAALPRIHATVRELIGKKPVFGICLGHQIMALALGGKTFKLKFGHRGANQPVKELATGKISITSQNHGFAVDPDSLPPEVEITHLHLNDNTVAGIRHREHPAFAVQYHPEASPGPHDAGYFFERFAKVIDATRPAC